MPFNISKKVLSIATFSLLSAAIYAQQLPVMNHYIYNPYLLNPARAGEKNHGSISVNFKKQWVNMPNSPVTGMILGETPISDSRLGFGGMIYSDKMHIINKVGGLATVSYHLPLADKHRLSGGISLGALNQRLNVAEAQVSNPNDPQLLPSANTGTTIDFSLGLNYNFNQKLNVGLAMLQGLGNSVKYLNANNDSYTDFTLARHFLATVSYEEIKMGEFGFAPTVMARFIKGLPVQAEANLLFNWRQFLYLGVGYRSSNTNTATSALMGTFALQIKERIFFAYTADLGLSKAQNTSLGSQHELMVTYKFGKQKNKAEEERMQMLMDELQATKANQNQMSQNLNEQTKKNTDLESNQSDMQKRLAEQEALNKEQQAQIEAHQKELEEIRKKLDAQTVDYKRMGSVHFAEGKSTLTTNAKTDLDAMLPTLQKHKSSTIYLYGRASTKGSAEANQRLSSQRAIAVRQYLVSKGIDNIELIPVGASDPENGTQKDNANDRRVDIYMNLK